MSASIKTSFAPQLFIKNGIKDISFYEKAFGAVELRRFSNEDGSIHVAELSINGALFHLHEEKFMRVNLILNYTTVNRSHRSICSGRRYRYEQALQRVEY
jgi:uncharacterized glyoxalase superfamily protein PhnB